MTFASKKVVKVACARAERLAPELLMSHSTRHLSRLPERREAADEIIRHAEIEPFRFQHFQCKLPFALALDFLRAGQLKLNAVAHLVANHLLQHVINRRREQVHPKPAEPGFGRQIVDA